MSLPSSFTKGMRVMQQNLKTLDDLKTRMDRLMSESDALIDEMDSLEVGEMDNWDGVNRDAKSQYFIS